MSAKDIATLVATLTIAVNLALAYFGVNTQLSCTVAHALSTAYAAVVAP